MSTDEHPAFRVIVDGHEYAVYPSGKVSGFEGNSILIANYIGMYEAQAIAEFCQAKGIQQ